MLQESRLYRICTPIECVSGIVLANVSRTKDANGRQRQRGESRLHDVAVVWLRTERNGRVIIRNLPFTRTQCRVIGQWDGKILAIIPCREFSGAMGLDSNRVDPVFLPLSNCNKVVRMKIFIPDSKTIKYNQSFFFSFFPKQNKMHISNHPVAFVLDIRPFGDAFLVDLDICRSFVSRDLPLPLLRDAARVTFCEMREACDLDDTV